MPRLRVVKLQVIAALGLIILGVVVFVFYQGWSALVVSGTIG